MYRNNKIWLGLAIGTLLPAIGFGVLWGLFYLSDQLELSGAFELSEDFRLRTLSIVAIGLNILPMNRFQKLRAEKVMRGILIATGVLVIVWIAIFKDSIFG